MSVALQNLTYAREISPRIITRSRNSQVKLIPVSIRHLADFSLENVADMICIDIHEYGVDTSIKEIRQFCKRYWDQDIGIAPCIFALGSNDVLNEEELWAISQQMEAAGGIFYAWPDRCHSFAEAYNVLADELVANYGALEDLDTV